MAWSLDENKLAGVGFEPTTPGLSGVASERARIAFVPIALEQSQESRILLSIPPESPFC